MLTKRRSSKIRVLDYWQFAKMCFCELGELRLTSFLPKYAKKRGSRASVGIKNSWKYEKDLIHVLNINSQVSTIRQ